MIAFLRGGGRGLDLGAGEVAGVDEALVREGLHRGDMGRGLVGLDDGADVPVDAEPGEEVDGEVDHAGLDARGVEVLDAEEDVPAALAGDGPVDEEGAGVAEVESPGGAGCEAGARG